MNNKQKIEILKNLIDQNSSRDILYYDVLGKIGCEKTNYYDYLTTSPIDCDKELNRVSDADYELCSALLTMLLREDCKCQGTLAKRVRNGDVRMILNRMIELLETNKEK